MYKNIVVKFTENNARVFVNPDMSIFSSNDKIIENPDLSSLIGVDLHFWKIGPDNTIIEMSPEEKVERLKLIDDAVIDNTNKTEEIIKYINVPIIKEIEKEVIKYIEIPVEKIIEVEKKIVEYVEVPIEKIVEIPTEVKVIEEKIIEKIKEVEKPIYSFIDRLVFKDRIPKWVMLIMGLETLIIMFLIYKR